MNTLKNKVQLIGNLGAAPEIRILQSGTKVARMRLATNEIRRNAQGEKTEHTQWHTLVAWGNEAEIAEKYLQKGAEVLVEGKIEYRSYTDKTGVERYVTEIEVHHLLMLDKKAAA
jgi:single-strand DNA-binding protein